MERATYADYELNKVDEQSTRLRLKIRDDQSGETRWISITPETLSKIRTVLAESPECQW